MRVLLDTCSFLWFISADAKLTKTASAVISDPSNDVLLSVVSAWEIAMKYRAGKLELDEPPAVIIPKELTTNSIGVLSVTIEQVLATASLPLHHRDPFDRLLVAQCLAENIPIVSPDVAFDPYGIRRIW